MKQFLILLSLCLFLISCSHSNREIEFDVFCIEPAEVSVDAMELDGVTYPSSPLRIAQDLADPLDNLHRYGIKVHSSIQIKNVSRGTIYIDSIEVEMARANGSDPSRMKMALDSTIMLTDSADTTIEWNCKVSAKEMDLQFMEDLLLSESVSMVQATPKLFIRFDESHICQESDAFVEAKLGEAAEMAVTATAATVHWMVTHPKESLDILLAFISVALKCL